MAWHHSPSPLHPALERMRQGVPVTDQKHRLDEVGNSWHSERLASIWLVESNQGRHPKTTSKLLVSTFICTHVHAHYTCMQVQHKCKKSKIRSLSLYMYYFNLEALLHSKELFSIQLQKNPHVCLWDKISPVLNF